MFARAYSSIIPTRNCLHPVTLIVAVVLVAVLIGQSWAASTVDPSVYNCPCSQCLGAGSLAGIGTGGLSTNLNVPAFGEFSLLGPPFVKWDPFPNTSSQFTGSPKSPGAATWSIMPAGASSFGSIDPHADNFSLPFFGLISGAAAGMETTFIDQAFDAWAAASDVTNLGAVAEVGVNDVDASDTASPGSNDLFGDIRFGAFKFDGPGGVLAHATQPGNVQTFPSFPSIGGDIHLDAEETWIDVELDSGGFDFFSIVLHEIGHALGLGHSDVVGSVMHPDLEINQKNRILTADDITGIRSIYGMVPEPGSLVVWLFLFVSSLVFVGRRTTALLHVTGCVAAR